MLSNRKTDKQGYDECYKGRISRWAHIDDPAEYVRRFETSDLSPYSAGGNTKGYVRWLALSELIKAADAKGVERQQLTILDAACGLGGLSVYLACKGFKVIGVDISGEGCTAAEHLARRAGVSQNCIFLPENLENMSVPNSSVDFIIGHAALHHFIKYEKVPKEFARIMKDGSQGFFADSFGENKLFHVFHNKEKMERLGDVILTKRLITDYFHGFTVNIVPTDWFVMLDKIYLKFLPRKFGRFIRAMSRIHFWLDRKIPQSTRSSLFLSGAVMTSIKKTNPT